MIPMEDTKVVLMATMTILTLMNKNTPIRMKLVQAGIYHFLNP